MIKTDGTYVPESAQVKIIAYLGVMLGVRGAGALVVKTAQSAGAEIGKKVARQAKTTLNDESKGALIALLDSIKNS